MSTDPAVWRAILTDASAHQTFSVTFKVGRGQEDGTFRRAIGRFNWYARREIGQIRIALVQDETTLLKVCSDGEWSGETPQSGHRTGIEFSVIGLIDIDHFIRDIEPAVESIKQVLVSNFQI